MIRRGVIALVCALAAAATAAPSALAHATLVSSTPARNAVVKTEPAQVVFKFDQGVEGAFGAVKVFDASADRVDDGEVFHPGGRQSQLGVKLKAGLDDGTYTAAYRVISADGHPVEGGVIFSIGAAGVTGSQSIEQLLGTGNAGKITKTAFDVVRGLDYLAIALAVGILAFLLACWMRGLAAVRGEGNGWEEATAALESRARRMLLGAIALGLVVALLGIIFEGASAGGTTFWAALKQDVVREVLKTRFGTIWALKAGVWVLLGSVVLLAPAAKRFAWAAGPAVLLLVAPALSGHADTQGDKLLLVPSDVIHVAAMSVWFGGLVALVALVPRATGALDPGDRSRLLSAVLLRFSPIALGAVVVLEITGTIQSIEYLHRFGDFLHTAFGRAVLIKIVLIFGLVALGAVNRRRTVPRMAAHAAAGEAPGDTGRLLRTTLRTEVAAIVVVLGVTAALVSYPPPSNSTTGSTGVNVHRRFGPLTLDATVDPARVGPNTMHLYLFGAKTGTPFEGTKEIEATATLKGKGIGPLPITLVKSGPGHYTADSFTLSAPGEWTIEVNDRISTFDQYTTTFTVKAG